MSIGLERGNKCLSALEKLHTNWQDTFVIKCIKKNVLPRLATALQAFQCEHNSQAKYLLRSSTLYKQPNFWGAFIV